MRGAKRYVKSAFQVLKSEGNCSTCRRTTPKRITHLLSMPEPAIAVSLAPALANPERPQNRASIGLLKPGELSSIPLSNSRTRPAREVICPAQNNSLPPVRDSELLLPPPKEEMMKPRLCFPVALLLIASPVLLAQRPAQESESRPQSHHENVPRANQGHIPSPPPKSSAHNFKREEEHRQNGSVDH